MSENSRQNQIIEDYISLYLDGKNDGEIASLLQITAQEALEIGRIVRAVFASSQDASPSPENLKKILSQLESRPVTNPKSERFTLGQIFSTIQSSFWQKNLAATLAISFLVFGLWLFISQINNPKGERQLSLAPTQTMDKSAPKSPLPNSVALTPNEAAPAAQNKSADTSLAQPMLAMSESQTADEFQPDIDALMSEMTQEDEIMMQEIAYVSEISAQDDLLGQYKEIIIE